MIVTVAQQKGGVGKTTTALSLAAIAARADRRVLAVDIDPQFSLTRQIGVDFRSLPLSIVDVLVGRVPAADAIVADVHSVDVLPAARELAGVELALVGGDEPRELPGRSPSAPLLRADRHRYTT